MKKIFLLLWLVHGLSISAQSFENDTLQFTGNSDERINLVILGDGYRENELDSFVVDAQHFINVFFQESPFKEYQQYFNVFLVKAISNESGASHPGTATDVDEPAHPVKTVDNYFGSVFDYSGIHRLLVAVKSFEISNVLANSFPFYDQALLLVNTPYYGGSGGTFPVSSTLSFDIAIHELGHSFAGLADEYYAGDVYAAERINMTMDSNQNTIKWKKWLDIDDTGIYQHCCGGNSALWYRPHESCKMRYLGYPFCNVCQEGIENKIKSLLPFTISIDDLHLRNEMNVNLYPNPTEGRLNIEMNSPGNYRLTLYNVFEEALFFKTNMAREDALDISDLPTGIYFIHVYDGDKLVSVKKVLKK